GYRPRQATSKGRPERRDKTSNDRDRRRLRRFVSVVAGPLELERAALGGDGGEGEQRIGRHRRVQLGAEHFDAVIGADEPSDDVARDELARLRAPEAGLHDVTG